MLMVILELIVRKRSQIVRTIRVLRELCAKTNLDLTTTRAFVALGTLESIVISL